MDDLNQAVKVADIALEATPKGHPDRAGRLTNLGNWLSLRFKRTGSIDDLNRAVKIAGMALAATPKDHPNRTAGLNNLRDLLGT
jgi:hypothetical protein